MGWHGRWRGGVVGSLEALGQAVAARLESLLALGEEQRWAAWRTAWAMFRDHPWTGVGCEQVAGHWFSYADPSLPRGLLFSRAHSEPLHILASTGILGAAVALVGLALLAHTALSAHRMDRRASAPMIGALVAFCVVVAPGFHTIYTASLAAVCAGLLVRVGKR
jgi:O-antigen ligase